MATANGNMRVKIADFTAKMKKWSVCVTLNDEVALASRGSPFSLLKELLSGPRTTLLMVHASASHHFNALEQLARACVQQRVWSAVLKPSKQGIKELVVYVPQFSSPDKVTEEVQRLAQTMQLAVALNVVDCDNVPHFVVDALVLSILTHDLEGAGCTIIGESAELQIVLSPNEFMGNIATVALPQIQWQYDPYRQSCSIDMTCIPVVMRLTTIAEDSELEERDEEDSSSWVSSSRIRVLPHLSEGWVVSRFDQCEGGFASSLEVAHGPQTDEDFRRYWLEVHGIHLPKSFGGYARIRFSSYSVLTYPACCVATEWRPLYKQTRVESLDLLRGLAKVFRNLYGNESVHVSSPDDEPQKVVLLPASALRNPEPATSNIYQRTSSHPAKRRMIARGQFTVS